MRRAAGMGIIKMETEEAIVTLSAKQSNSSEARQANLRNGFEFGISTIMLARNRLEMYRRLFITLPSLGFIQSFLSYSVKSLPGVLSLGYVRPKFQVLSIYKVATTEMLYKRR